MRSSKCISKTLKFLSTNFITRFFAPSCKVRKTNKNTKPQNNGSHCTSRSTLFHTGNKAKYLVCLSCTMHCVVSLLFQLCRLDNGSGKRKINSHPFTFKLLSISIGVNSHVLNSPQTFQNHLKNSKNILLVHEVVVKRHAASRKRKCSLAEKLVSVCC